MPWKDPASPHPWEVVLSMSMKVWKKHWCIMRRAPCWNVVGHLAESLSYQNWIIYLEHGKQGIFICNKKIKLLHILERLDNTRNKWECLKAFKQRIMKKLNLITVLLLICIVLLIVCAYGIFNQPTLE